MVDYDLNLYPIFSIGVQCQIALYLKFTKYNDGNLIPDGTDNTLGQTCVQPCKNWLNSIGIVR